MSGAVVPGLNAMHLGHGHASRPRLWGGGGGGVAGPWRDRLCGEGDRHVAASDPRGLRELRASVPSPPVRRAG